MNNCTPDNKYPPKPCPCPEIPGPPGPPGPQGLIGPQGIPGDPASPGTEFDIWHVDNVTGASFEGSVTTYTAPFTNVMVSTNVSKYKYKGVKPLTARNLIFQIATNTYTGTLGNIATITVQVNGVNTLLALGVVGGPNLIVANTVNSIPIVTDDEISIQVFATSGGAGSFTLRYLTFQVDYPG